MYKRFWVLNKTSVKFEFSQERQIKVVLMSGKDNAHYVEDKSFSFLCCDVGLFLSLAHHVFLS